MVTSNRFRRTDMIFQNLFVMSHHYTKKVVLEFWVYMNFKTFTLNSDYAGKCTMYNINIIN